MLSFNTERRLLLTGTPLQNDMIELWSLMHFLMPDVFQSQAEFKEWFAQPVTAMVEGKESMNKKLISRLHNVLRPFILRRLKKDVAKQLPKKIEHTLKCRLSRRQRRLYEDFMNAADTQTTLQSGNYMSLMGVLMQLRKVCNHPDIFAGRPITSPFDQVEPLTLVVPSLVHRLTPPRDAQPAITYIQSMSEVNLDLLNLLITGHHAYTWEASRVAELCGGANSNLAQYTSASDPALEYTPSAASISTSSELGKSWEEVGKKRQAWRVSRREHFASINQSRCKHLKPMYALDLLQTVTLPPWSASQVHLMGGPRQPPCTSALQAMVVLPELRAEQTLDLVKTFMCVVAPARACPPILSSHHPEFSREQRAKNLYNSVAAQLSSKTDMLRPAYIRRQLHFPDKRLLQWDCGKLQRLALLLSELKAGGHRVLIFTQMTKMLDILESFLNIYAYNYLRLDGSTKVEDRSRLIERYNNTDKIFAFILSTRSGGIGINLTGADTVIFYDIDWNPAMDLQAQDRCHRIGQTREVKTNLTPT
jgi:E1A-binding protein p400